MCAPPKLPPAGRPLWPSSTCEYKDWLGERSYGRDDPEEVARRRKIDPGRWWYIHSRDRCVYKLLDRLAKRGTFFNFLIAHPAKSCTLR